MKHAADDASRGWATRRQHLMVQPFARAVECSAVPTVLMDARLDDHPIVFANASFLRLSACNEGQALGQNLRFLNAVDADPDVLRQIEAAADAGKEVSVDIRLSRPDGVSFWARMDASPIFGPDGRADLFVATVVDVSDRVRAVQGLRAAEESFERRVEARTAALESALARTELLSREVSHRTKNALAILGALIEARRRRAEDPAVADALGEVSGEIRAIGRLQGLLEGVGREDGRIDLAELMVALAEELDSRSGVHVIVGRTCVAGVSSNAAQALALSVIELVLNAQKHAFPDGREGMVVIEAEANAAGLVVTVSDNGTGLPDGFDPETGTGLGMLVVLDQVARLDGRLACGRSAAGGARFSIKFPL
jgi:PAS domain S-box-containing protein